MAGKLGFCSTTAALQAERDFAGSTASEDHLDAASLWQIRGCGGTAPGYDPLAVSLHPFGDAVRGHSWAGAYSLALTLLAVLIPELLRVINWVINLSLLLF